MYKQLLFLVLLLFIGHMAAAQYKNAGGLRIGHTSGITYKHFVNDKQAIELLLGWREGGAQFTGTYQWHTPLPVGFSEHLYFLYGVGGHFGFEERSNFYQVSSGDQVLSQTKNYFTMGVDGIFGIEYRWLTVPLSISLDVKPYLQFVGMRDTHFRFWDVGLGVKYIF